jgi:geranylgeranyl pyrophosphate synthase
MASEERIITKVKALLWEKGMSSLEIARQAVLQEKVPFTPFQEALRFFILNWEDVLHPALLALSCEAVGGKPETTTQIGAALVLLAGGADVHDDVIDQSDTKDAKQTVYGKFGKDLSIVVGDALLFKGLYKLHEATADLPRNKRIAILELTKKAFFGISSAEADEVSLRGKIEPDVAEKYLEMVKMKAAVGEATTKIGAILGDGPPEKINMLGRYGKTLATLYTLRDEFIDAFELAELNNRVNGECLPLPILLTLKDSKKAEKIRLLLKNGRITERNLESLLTLTFDSKETKDLKNQMKLMVRKESQHIRFINLEKNVRKNPLTLLLQSTIQGL